LLSKFKKLPINFYKWYVNRLSFSAIKGFCILRKDNPDLVNEIRNKIADKQIDIKRTFVENLFFPKEVNISLTTQQYLLKMLMGRMFTRNILSCIYSKKRLIYPLPLSWTKIVDNSGIHTSYLLNCILFYIFILFFLFFGIYNFFNLILKNSKRHNFKNNYAYFFDLKKNCFPISNRGESYDLISWYIKKFDKLKKTPIIHSVPSLLDKQYLGYDINYVQDHFPMIARFDFFLKLLPKLIFLIFFITPINILLLRWWNLLFLKEMIDLKVFEYAKKVNIASQYFFHFSFRVYRPLWTYIAEEKGSDLIYYYYSSHISTYRDHNGKYSTVPEFWQVMNWPIQLIWNKHHADFIRGQLNYPSDLRVVGPIWFQDYDAELPTINQPAILAFDITPYREFFCYTFANAQKYNYDYKVAVSFLQDLQEVSNDLGIDLYFKRKRNSIDNAIMLNRKYLSFLEKFLKNDNVTEIHPAISVDRISMEFDFIVSQPFTSAAVSANLHGKESVYYDPIGIIQKNDRATHNLTLINGKAELKSYLKRLLENSLNE
jgi:polysaccharide biosynthesis PFTS motif protein